MSVWSISKYLVIHQHYTIYNVTLLPLSAELMNIMSSHVSISSAELCRINEHQKVALDLDPYVKKLLNARRRVVLVNNILQNAQVRDWDFEYKTSVCLLSSSSPIFMLQERLRRLNHNVAKETARRKTMLEASGAFTPRSPSKPWCLQTQILGLHYTAQCQGPTL